MMKGLAALSGRSRIKPQRKRRGPKPKLTESLHLQIYLLIRMRLLTACLSRCHSGKWLVVIIINVKLNGFNSHLLGLITNPKGSGIVQNVGGKQRKPCTKLWKKQKRRGHLTGSPCGLTSNKIIVNLI